ncbi:MAG TPA: YetF domain-containing protein [Urbifossiella sp.]|nr:YetF domain-containing protein [Urbifossiella sp.]
MPAFHLPDWGAVFVPDGSLLESFLRGSVVYFAVLVLFRVVLRRQTGGMGLSDVLLVVLASECVSPALSAETRSVPNGVAALAALLFWSYALDWATDRWPWLNRALEPPPVELVRDGVPKPDALHAQHVTDDELMSQLRLNGVDDLSQVKVATLEPGGDVSVVTRGESEEKREGSKENGTSSVSPTPPPTDPDGPPDLDAALKQFLSAAADVRAAVAWHDDRAAAHKRAAAAARAALARHGVRSRTSPAVPARESPA